MKKTNSQTRPRPSRLRRFIFAFTTVILSTFLAIGVCEIVFRILEYRENAHNINEGPGGHSIPDERWGWKPSPGAFHIASAEYDVTGNINSLSMNDLAYNPNAEEAAVRVLALGDSHTYAVGVSMERTWPKLVEAKLNSLYGPGAFRVYNGGAVGYSMHQYLLRLMDQGPTLRPTYVVLGLSYATDLYDLLPPDRGGWVYGGDTAREFFDFDSNGNLTERHWEPKSTPIRITRTAQTVREILEYSAGFRYLRRSSLSLFVGSHIKVRGQSLWPNMDIILEKNVQPEHQYQWRLFEALLQRIKNESDRQGARLIVVGIPYLPQVYDDIWNSTFGGNDSYSRTAAIERVEAVCQKLGVAYVDTLGPLHQKSKELGRWVHYRKDAHPTVEGHEVIADTLVKLGVIQPNSK
jgi:lysophospholipase L1-like esterase